MAIRVDVTLDVEDLSILDSIGFTAACRVVNGEEVAGRTYPNWK